MQDNGEYARLGYVTPEILTFLGVATIAAILIWKRATHGTNSVGFNFMVFGVTYIAVAVFLDYIIDTPANKLFLQIFSRDSWRVLLQLGGYLPGSLCIGVGIFKWLPALARLEDEVAQRKQMETALGLTQFSVDHAGDAIYWIGVDGKFEYANQSAKELLGLEWEELGKIHIWDLDHNVNPDRWSIIWDRLQSTERNLFETTLSSKSRGEVQVEVTTVPIVNGDRHLVCSYSRDITKRKQTEKVKEQLSQAVETVPVGIALFDAEDQLVFCNKSYRKQMDVVADILQPGITFEKIIRTMVERQPVKDALGREEKFIQERVMQHRNPKGSVEIRRENSWLLADEIILQHGGIFTIITDITERKRLEDQVRHSQKLEAVGQLTGGIAHDFNNLMAIMVGNLELAMEQVEPDAPLRNNIKNALMAVDRGAELTQHLLSFSRQQTLSPAVTDVKQLVEGTITFLERALGEDIQIITKHSEEENLVYIDATVFGTALVNLAINARDAMPEGGTLSVSTDKVSFAGEKIGAGKEPAHGDYALITVSDTGSGISQNNLEQVLEPFFTTKEVGKGSGLGLSMVYGFVTQSKGHIKITSKEGEGSTVFLYLPISDEEREFKDNEATLAPEIRTECSILLVEDDQHVRATTLATLVAIGYKVIEAEDGPTTLEILNQRSGDIDLVLSDIVMPNGMSGIDLARKIAAEHTHIKVLLTSGYPDKIASQSEIKAMNIEVLAKPFTRVQLVTAIENVVSGRTRI